MLWRAGLRERADCACWPFSQHIWSESTPQPRLQPISLTARSFPPTDRGSEARLDTGMEGRTAVLPAHRPCAGAASSSSGRAAPAPPLLPPRHRRVLQPAAALQPEHVEALSSSLGHLMTLAYEPVVLPCSALNCGDIVYRRWVLGRARDLTGGGWVPPTGPTVQSLLHSCREFLHGHLPAPTSLSYVPCCAYVAAR